MTPFWRSHDGGDELAPVVERLAGKWGAPAFVSLAS